MTSKWGTRSRMMLGASGALRSRVMLFLFRAYTFQCTLTPASRQSRRVSPRPSDSTFTTSAPKSLALRFERPAGNGHHAPSPCPLPRWGRGDRSDSLSPSGGEGRVRGVRAVESLPRCRGGGGVEGLRGQIHDHAVDGARALHRDLAL